MIAVRPLRRCDATLSVPGSKSYTHRALIVAALSQGESVLLNALRSDDTDCTAQALRDLGIPMCWEEDRIHVWGGRERLRPPNEALFCGASGTSMRFLTAVAALVKGRTTLVGSERMKERPMTDLFSGLAQMGVKARSWEEDDALKVLVESQGIDGGEVAVKGTASSQFLSALLMVAPYAKEDVRLEIVDSLVSKPYVEVTLDVMKAFGAVVEREGENRFLVVSGRGYRPRIYSIEADASSASYFFAAAAVTKGRVKIMGLNPHSIQADANFLEILKRMGCDVLYRDDGVEVYGRKLQAIEMDMAAMPDLVPALAVTAAFAHGKTIIKGIGHLRHKESDRISVVARELTKMGVAVEEGEDWLRIEGGRGHAVEIVPEGDHRIAMAFAIAGLVIPGIMIQDHECVRKSFPGFWETFGRLYG